MSTVDDWNDPDFARTWAESQTNGPHSPLRDEQIDLLLRLLRAHLSAGGVPPRVLDLGCGPGIIAARVLESLAQASLAGVDASPPMLDLARERLAPYAGRFQLAPADFETMTPENLPGGPFGAAFAVQAIHNCSDEGKRRALASVRAVMAPGGLFVLSDRIRVTSSTVFPAYLTLWDKLDEQYAPRGWQHSEGRSFPEHERVVVENGDKPGSLEQNLLWLREAGFAEVAAVHVIGVRAVIVAVALA
jgi:ubiquinone/menaquinone biosynthesis C-methylase UbiE